MSKLSQKPITLEVPSTALTASTTTRGNGGAVPKQPANGRFHNYRGTLLIALFALVLWLNVSFLKPVLMGAIFAATLYPLMEKSAHWKLTQGWRAALITLGFTIVILGPIGVVIVVGADAALEKLQMLQELNPTAGTISSQSLLDALGLTPWIGRIGELVPFSDVQVRQYLVKGVTAIGGVLIGGLQGFVASLPGILFSNIVIIFTIFYLLIDGPRAVAFIRSNSIFGKRQTDHLIEVTRALCNSVIVASLVAGAVQAGLIGIACLLTGTPGIPLIVFVSFLCSFFPMVGTAPVTIFLTAQAFLSGNATAGIIFLISIPVVGTSDNVVRPYMIKGGAELHPLIAFVSAFGALEVIGFYGLFIGPIVAGLFFTLLPMVTRSYGQSAR